MVVGRPLWEYRPCAEQPVEQYFIVVSALAERLQVQGELALPADRNSPTALSLELQALVRQLEVQHMNYELSRSSRVCSELLTVNPEQRLGCNGADEVRTERVIPTEAASAQAHVYAGQVMAHPWFDGVDWELLEAKETRQSEIEAPYNLQTDFLCDANARIVSVADDLSSAGSIDPEVDAMYFADF
ncbi:hypothetical protein PybrP1_007432 [[Pythium] brassicae (nom. inval.)]|nr:hypothetical protein PybrP1_007432 [[Pythium] brassicae (nom. inval.)]